MKKNKKVYNFTDRQRRRDRSLGKTFHYHTVGRYCKTKANKKFRRQNKEILRQILLNEVNISFIRYRKYMWWDM